MQRINAEFLHETTLALKCPMFWCRSTFMTVQISLWQCQLIFLRIFRNTESTDPFLLVAHHRHSFLAFDPFRYVCLGSRAISVCVCNNLFRNQWSAGHTRSTLDQYQPTWWGREYSRGAVNLISSNSTKTVVWDCDMQTWPVCMYLPVQISDVETGSPFCLW